MARKRVITIGFHDIVEDLEMARPAGPGFTTAYTVDRRMFNAHLGQIQRSAAVTSLRSIERARLESVRNPVLLTFDDGTRGCFECAAPELEAFGWRGHFFVTTSWIGRDGFLDRCQIADLHRRGHLIGSHSVTHPERMSQLGWEAMVREWSESCKILSEIVGEQVAIASVPDGYSSPAVCRAAAACGIGTLFTSEPTATARIVDGCMVLGRYAIQRSTPPSVAGAIAAGARGPRYGEAALWLAKKCAKQIGGRWYIRMRRFVLTRANS